MAQVVYTDVRVSHQKWVKEFFEVSVKNTATALCPFCNKCLNGHYQRGHFYPVSQFGDARPDRILIAMHPNCNQKLHTNVLDCDLKNSHYIWTDF